MFKWNYSLTIFLVLFCWVGTSLAGTNTGQNKLEYSTFSEMIQQDIKNKNFSSAREKLKSKELSSSERNNLLAAYHANLGRESLRISLAAARPHYEKFYKLYPIIEKTPRVETDLAIYLNYIRKDTKKAIRVNQGIIQKNPDFSPPYYNLFLLYSDQGEYEKAFDILQMHEQRIGGEKQHYFQLLKHGMLLHKNIENRYYKKLDSLVDDPEKIRLLKSLSDAAITSRNRKYLRRIGKDLVRLSPHDFVGYSIAAYYYINENNFEKSIKSGKRFLSKSKETKDVYKAYRLLLQLYVQTDKISKAKNIADLCMSGLESQRVYCITSVGEMLWLGGEYTKSIDVYHNALSSIDKVDVSSKKQKRTNALSGLARNYASLGQNEQAQKYIDESFKLKPDNPDALLAQGIIYYNLRKTEKARDFLTRSRDIYIESLWYFPNVPADRAQMYLDKLQ